MRGKNPLYVKDCGMGEKKEGKENKKCSTMPNVLIKGYKILRTVRVGQDFSLAEVEHKQSGIPDCLCGSHRLIHYDSYAVGYTRLLMRVASFDTLRFLPALY